MRWVISQKTLRPCDLSHFPLALCEYFGHNTFLVDCRIKLPHKLYMRQG